MGSSGSGNASATVLQTISLDMTIEQYDEVAVRTQLAALYGVAPEQIELSVVAGSVELTVTITALTSTTAGVNAVSSASLASSLGRAVLNVSSAQAVAPQAASCAEGYGGPYCAVCATGYFGGGEGGTCSTCADAGNPTVTVAIQGGVAFAVIVLVTLLMLKFGKKALATAASTLDNAGNEDGALANIKDTVQADLEERVIETMDEKLEEADQSKSKTDRCMSLLGKVGRFISSFGVKLKILVSLYQVLTGLGMTFNIPYPDTYTEWLSKISAIELDSERVIVLAHMPAYTNARPLDPLRFDRPFLTLSHFTRTAAITARHSAFAPTPRLPARRHQLHAHAAHPDDRPVGRGWRARAGRNGAPQEGGNGSRQGG